MISPYNGEQQRSGGFVQDVSHNTFSANPIHPGSQNTSEYRIISLRAAAKDQTSHAQHHRGLWQEMTPVSLQHGICQVNFPEDSENSAGAGGKGEAVPCQPHLREKVSSWPRSVNQLNRTPMSKMHHKPPDDFMSPVSFLHPVWLISSASEAVEKTLRSQVPLG